MLSAKSGSLCYQPYTAQLKMPTAELHIYSPHDSSKKCYSPLIAIIDTGCVGDNHILTHQGIQPSLYEHLLNLQVPTIHNIGWGPKPIIAEKFDIHIGMHGKWLNGIFNIIFPCIYFPEEMQFFSIVGLNILNYLDVMLKGPSKESHLCQITNISNP